MKNRETTYPLFPAISGLLLLLCLCPSAHAHSGFVAFAVPLEGIIVDIWIATEGGVTRYRSRSTTPPADIVDVIADRAYGPVPSISIPTTQGYLSFAMGEIDLHTRQLRLADSGCPYPFHYSSTTGEVVELPTDAYPLGVRPDTEYTTIETQLTSGDYLVFCSDGIIEAANPQEEIFGFERTAEVVLQACREALSAEALIDRLEAVRTFTGSASQGDDITLIALAVRPCDRSIN